MTNKSNYLEKRAEYALALYPKALEQEKKSDADTFALAIPRDPIPTEQRAATKAIQQAEALLNALGFGEDL